MADLNGRKVRLVSKDWDRLSGVRRGAIRTVQNTRYGSLSIEEGYLAIVRPGSLYEVAVLPERTRIWVYSYGTPDRGAAFEWSPSDHTPGRDALKGLLNRDRIDGTYEYGVIAELAVAGKPAEITEYLDGELQDAIAAGLIGKIIERY